MIGVRPGKAAHPNLVFSAHLDTVFPEGTNVKVTREGSVLKGPGIGDDCRGLAVMLAVIRALNEAHVETPGTITFVADVGEEGLGDLRGMKQLFYDSLKGQIDKFVSVDGTGLGITNIGVGSNRYKVTFKGPGGHSYGAFGMANPIQAMGRAIAKIDAFEVPVAAQDDVQCGPRRRRHVRECDPVRGLDGGGHALRRSRRAQGPRRQVSRRAQAGGGRGEQALEQSRPGDGIGGTGRRAAGRTDAEGQRDRADRDGGLARAADRGSAARRLHRFQRADESGHPGDHDQRRRHRHRRALAERGLRPADSCGTQRALLLAIALAR